MRDDPLEESALLSTGVSLAARRLREPMSDAAAAMMDHLKEEEKHAFLEMKIEEEEERFQSELLHRRGTKSDGEGRSDE